MRPFLASLLLLSTTAFGVPLEIEHQGRLFDNLGVPLTGDHDLVFTLFDDASAGTVLWTETHDATSFDQGYFSLHLGSNTSLDADDFDGSIRYLAISVDGSVLPNRLALVSVPYAIHAESAETATSADTADTATNVSGGVVDATEIRIDGTTVIDNTGAISGSLPSHTHDAAEVDSGVLDILRIPVGTSATDVAAGDHLHTMGDITGGTVPIGMLPVGTSATDVAAGDHVHDAADTITGTFAIARLPVGVASTEVARGDHSHDYGTLTGLPVIPTASDTCAAGIAGAIRWNAPSLEYCDGAEWVVVQREIPPGLSVGDPASSCQQIKLADPALPSGVYWLDQGSGPYEAFCEQVIDGGGWTAVASFADDGNDYWTRVNWPFLISGNQYGDPADLTADHQSKAWKELTGSEVMLKVASDDTQYAIYDTILANEVMADQYQAGNNTGPEFDAATIAGTWWQQCGTALTIRLENQDSDGNTNFAKGIVARSDNNNGCNYDDNFGALQGDFGNNTTEGGWAIDYWYDQNFDADALVVLVR